METKRQKTSSELLDEVIKAAKGIRTAEDQERFQTLANEYRKQFDKEYAQWQKEHQEDVKRVRECHLAPVIPMWPRK